MARPVLVIFDVPSILRLSHTMSQGVPHYVPSVPDMSQTCPIPTLARGAVFESGPSDITTFMSEMTEYC